MISSKKGFTLLEVILAITILSTMMLITTQAISRALKARTKIQAEVDDVSALRDSMRMIRADVNLAFHHRDFEKEIQDLVKKPKTAGGALKPGQPAAPPSAPEPPREAPRQDPTTHFVGAENEMNFVTMNSARTLSNSVQADFSEVGYTLKSCNNLTTGKASNCLYRRTQNLPDEDVKTGGNEIVLLENVTEFKLRYIGESKQDWVNTWNSTNDSSDAGTKKRFPDAVEVSLTIERELEGKARSYSMQFVVPVHYSNNASDSATSTSTSPPVPGGGGAPGG